MAQCEKCGNDYDKAFTIEMGGRSHTFDSFECAIMALAPKCEHCGTRIIGHGLEEQGELYCSAQCAAHRRGSTHLADRA